MIQVAWALMYFLASSRLCAWIRKGWIPGQARNDVEFGSIVQETEISYYFFCDFPNQNLSPDMIIQKVLQMYKMRWKIEEMHRT